MSLVTCGAYLSFIKLSFPASAHLAICFLCMVGMGKRSIALAGAGNLRFES